MPTRPLTTTQLALNDKLQRASQVPGQYGFLSGQRQIICLICSTLTQRRESRFLWGRCMVSCWLIKTALESFAKGDRLIAVHAEDQARIKQRRQELLVNDPSVHSKYRITLQRFGYPTGSRTV